MAWTTPATAVTGDVVPASFWNTYGRDNLAYLKGLLDGTGSGAVTVPGNLGFNNDAQAVLKFITSNRIVINFDSYDYIEYDRANNWFLFNIGSGVTVFKVDANGKIDGSGFFDSGEVSIAAGGYATVNHGLGARPRLVQAWGNSGSGGADGKTMPFGLSTQTAANELRIIDVNSTRVYLYNGYGATYYANVYCIR